ncbi:hypothetical protein HDU67_010184, partial [Dinochytrium kinnereticum]
MSNLKTHVNNLDVKLRRIPSSLVLALLATLIYFAISKFALTTSIQTDYASFWPANGFLVGTWLQLTLLQSTFFLPMAFLVNLGVNLGRHAGLTAFLLSMVNVLECLLIYVSIRYFAPKYYDLATKRSAVTIVVSSIIGSALGGIFGAAVSCWQLKQSFSSYGFEFFKWTIADCLGNLTLIPFLLSRRLWRQTWDFILKHHLKGWIALSCLCGIIVVELSLSFLPKDENALSWTGTVPFINHMVSFLLVLLCGSAVGTAGFTTATFFLGISGAIATVLFIGQDDVVTSMLLFRLQIFIIISTISTLALMVIERGRQEALAKSIEASNQKSALIAFLCHELRNPLHAIVNTTAFLKDCPSTSRDQEQLTEAISIASTYMSQIINDVLDTTKFEAGNVKLSPAPTDLAALFRRTVANVHQDPSMTSMDVNMHLGMMPEGSRMFFVDEMRVKQLLNHLLSNAIKVTPAGGKIDMKMWCEENVTGETCRSSEDLNYLEAQRTSALARPVSVSDSNLAPCYTLCIDVTDSGPEISHDVAGITFKPFWVSNMDTVKDYGGAGLNLVICKYLVDLMHGSLKVSRGTDGITGSIFSIRIPVTMVPEAKDDINCILKDPSDVCTVFRADNNDTISAESVIENAVTASIKPQTLSPSFLIPRDASIDLITRSANPNLSDPIPLLPLKTERHIELDTSNPWLSVMANREPQLPSPREDISKTTPTSSKEAIA